MRDWSRTRRDRRNKQGNIRWNCSFSTCCYRETWGARVDTGSGCGKVDTGVTGVQWDLAEFPRGETRRQSVETRADAIETRRRRPRALHCRCSPNGAERKNESARHWRRQTPGGGRESRRGGEGSAHIYTGARPPSQHQWSARPSNSQCACAKPAHSTAGGRDASCEAPHSNSRRRCTQTQQHVPHRSLAAPGRRRRRRRLHRLLRHARRQPQGEAHVGPPRRRTPDSAVNGQDGRQSCHPQSWIRPSGPNESRPPTQVGPADAVAAAAAAAERSCGRLPRAGGGTAAAAADGPHGGGGAAGASAAAGGPAAAAARAADGVVAEAASTPDVSVWSTAVAS